MILAEQDTRLGGGLLADPAPIDGQDGLAWVAQAEARLAALGARVLKRATAAGYYDHNQLTPDRAPRRGRPDAPAPAAWPSACGACAPAG